MPKAKIKKNKKTAVKNTKTSVKKDQLKKSGSPQKFSEQIKLNESYVSLILGAIVVLSISAVVFVYISQARNEAVSQKVLNDSISPVLSRAPNRTHVMGEDESLWDVSVKYYGDGYRYVEIAEANKNVIDNPDFVPPGTRIVIPENN